MRKLRKIEIQVPQASGIKIKLKEVKIQEGRFNIEAPLFIKSNW
jgi:hypothetical protein